MLRAALAGGVLLLGVGACISIVGDFDNEGAGGAATTSSGSTGGAATTSSGSTGGAATTSSGALTSSSGSASASSSGSASASSSGSASASNSSSSGGPLPPVYCNSMACATGQICCYDPSLLSTPYCGQTGQCAQGDVELSCSSPQDCPGGICCGHVHVVLGVSVYSGISCSPTCGVNSTTDFPICEPNGADVCGSTQSCVQSQQLGFPYYVCNNN
jgi:hypothetical protein